ncbi:ArsR/SmtB family transcription factor [Pseudonocardia spinosispora]|uniref:ArsR/SmtB family transcription factor n=1 Tax=Pseudonocardia spinosispora TaxID=103441 RepID=UPI00041DA37A|nr:metalloregulator ArsR/SmtB family transcription factor [Pseudonocardia spinosispora]
MGDAVRKAELFDQLARIGKALSSGRRLELLDLLAQGPRGVADLAAAAGLGLTLTSAHLQTLKQAGLVAATRDGTTIRYRLADADVAALYVHLRDVAEAHLPDVDIARDRYLSTPEDADTNATDGHIEPVGADELLRRAHAGDIVVLDVRPATEYAAAHIPGALSIPIGELPARLAELPPNTEVVAYCRGSYCVFAHEAVRLLTAHGRRATRLTDGMLEWQLAQRPMATGAA